MGSTSCSTTPGTCWAFPATSRLDVIGAHLRRGVVAGLLAGLAAGLVALLLGEPALDAAIALEGPASGDGISRAVQKVGLVVGTSLVGLAIGALAGVALAWSQGRVAGDAWTRALKLGATTALAVVVLPALRYPPSPPGVGSGADVGTRTALAIGLGIGGLLLAGAAWSGARSLAGTGLSRPVRQVALALSTAAVAAVVLALLPGVEGADALPAELVWRFRLATLATQVTLYGGVFVVLGLLVARAEEREGRSLRVHHCGPDVSPPRAPWRRPSGGAP